MLVMPAAAGATSSTRILYIIYWDNINMEYLSVNSVKHQRIKDIEVDICILLEKGDYIN